MKETGKFAMNLFTNEKELVTILNFTVHKHTLNININAKLTCSIIQIYTNTDIKPTSQYIINNDQPSYVEEEIKSEGRSDKSVVVVCYRENVSKNRILESTTSPIILSIEYISDAVDKPKDEAETVLVIPEDSQNPEDIKPQTHSINYFYIFLGAVFFILIILVIIFFARRWKINNGNNNQQTKSKNPKIVESSSTLKSNENLIPQMSNPYQFNPK
jgi:ATP-dependent Zn protease